MPPMSTTETQQWQDASSVANSSEENEVTKISLNLEVSKAQCDVGTGKSVHFSKTVDVREVPPLATLPKEEIQATWYGGEEFKIIKQSLIPTIRLMMAKKPIDKNQECSRGLEFRTPAGAKARKANKLKALRAVWNEQVAQWKSDVSNDEAIRMVYEAESAECRAMALKLGQRDEQEARKYQNEGHEDENIAGSDSSSSGIDELPCIQEPVRSSLLPTAA